jgi:septal ring factor EnvC (AmiA/AmiB activator)
MSNPVNLDAFQAAVMGKLEHIDERLREVRDGGRETRATIAALSTDVAVIKSQLKALDAARVLADAEREKLRTALNAQRVQAGGISALIGVLTTLVMRMLGKG